jgi:hypothetical protein
MAIEKINPNKAKKVGNTELYPEIPCGEIKIKTIHHHLIPQTLALSSIELSSHYKTHLQCQAKHLNPLDFIRTHAA